MLELVMWLVFGGLALVMWWAPLIHCLRNKHLTAAGRKHFLLFIGLLPIVGSVMYGHRLLYPPKRRHEETGHHGRRWAKRRKVAHN